MGKLGSWGDNMHSKKLGRAAAAAGLMALLLPSAAFASWWDGGYDGRYDNGYSARRGDSTTTTTHRASPGYEQPPESDTAPGYESPGETPPPDDNPPPQCGQSGCTRYTPPPENNPPPDDNPPPQCGQSGCTRYTPPRDCGQPDCAPPPSPPQCGQPACDQAPPPPPPPPYLVGPIYGCENSDLPDTPLILHKTTTPPPGTPVRPGDEILVDVTWHVWDWTGPDLHKAIDCVYINGLFVPELSGGERPTPNDGHFGFHYFVPLDVPPGSEICDQGFVSGPNGWEDYGRAISNVVCFPVDVPPPPPPPTCCTPPEVETTTTTTAPEEAQPYAESERLSQEEAPAAALPEAHDVLPRTGSGPGTARLAAAGLGLVALIRRRLRRG
jgi:hypothetical protein